MNDDDAVRRFLAAAVPGGSTVADWFLPHETPRGIENVRAAVRLGLAAARCSEPIDMILHCPRCGLQHVDAAEDLSTIKPDDPLYSEGREIWTNPPHRSHLCAGCGFVWRPADVPTNGVAAIKTRGKADSTPLMPDSGPVTIAMPVEITREQLRAINLDPTTRVEDTDERHLRLGWLLSVWDVLVAHEAQQ